VQEEKPKRKAASKKEPKAATEEQAEDGESSPSNLNLGSAAAEVDPMVHLVETIVADRKEPGSARQYMVKYKNLSYHNNKWFNEEEFISQFSFQCQ